MHTLHSTLDTRHSTTAHSTVCNGTITEEDFTCCKYGFRNLCVLHPGGLDQVYTRKVFSQSGEVVCTTSRCCSWPEVCAESHYRASARLVCLVARAVQTLNEQTHANWCELNGFVWSWQMLRRSMLKWLLTVLCSSSKPLQWRKGTLNTQSSEHNGRK